MWKQCGISVFLRVARKLWLGPQADSMTSIFSGRFYKGRSCPSSQSLLAYYRAVLPVYQLNRVEVHLKACDFCNAELQLLARHQNYFADSPVDEMPAQLRRLAERVLNQSGV
jgi:hypothetical protein